MAIIDKKISNAPERHFLFAGRALAFASIAAALSGCAGLIPPSPDQPFLDSKRFMVGAMPLAEMTEFKDSDDKRAVVGAYIKDSRKKCDDFQAELAVAQTSQDAGLDWANSIFGALGTAFTPVSTVHAFTAAGSITSGWKAALDTDVYAKATIANYAQAIQSKYGKDMADYTTALQDMDPAKIVPVLEYTKVQSIHSECTLAAAQSTISASLQAGTGTTQGGQQTKTVTFGADISAGSGVVIDASSTALTGGHVKLSLPPTSMTKVEAAKAFADAVNNDPQMKAHNITAKTPGDNTVVLSWPSTLTITWTLPPGAALGANGPTKGQASISLSPTTGTTTGNTVTQAVVPGQSVH